MEFENNELIKEGFITQISQLSPLVKGLLPQHLHLTGQSFRGALFSAILGNKLELNMDEVQAAQLPELLALANYLNPPTFLPSENQPGDLVQSKAGSFAASYLHVQFSTILGLIGLPIPLIQELTVDGSDYALAQLRHLQLNYRQTLKVADYLQDQKSLIGQLGAITAKLAVSFVKTDAETVTLLGQIGQELALAVAIIKENEEIHDLKWLTDQIMRGSYPLLLLFAKEKDPKFFDHFFSQPKKPSKPEFEALQAHCLQAEFEAVDIVKDILRQVRLDLKILPAPLKAAPLLTLCEQILPEE